MNDLCDFEGGVNANVFFDLPRRGISIGFNKRA